MPELVENTGPLKGVRVLDLSRVLAGPTATQLLGDFGADILKIEKPGLGDDTRAWGPPFVTDSAGNATQESAYYLSSNRNKRSVAVDISTPEGAATVRALLASCDVLVENFKLGGLKKYGLAYDDLKDAFPGLVYCSITGFGQTGPNAAKPGYDLLAQGYGGIMSLTGPAEAEPAKVGVAIADVMTGMYAATAILAALRHAEATGQGQHIDLSLVDCQVAWLVNAGTNYLMTGTAPVRRGNQHPNIVPYQVFKVIDGHVIVAVGNDAQFQRFCAILGAEELASDPRFATNQSRLAHREVLIDRLEVALASVSRDWLIAEMEAHGVPGGPINDLEDVFEGDQVAARGMKITMPHAQSGSGQVSLIGNPVKFSETPVSYRRAPPVCGADTADVLSELVPEDSEDTGEPAGS